MVDQFRRSLFACLGIATLVAGLMFSSPSAEGAPLAKVFATPEAAADALVIAIAANRHAELEEILGENWKSFIPVDGVDPVDVDRFLDAWAESHTILYETLDYALLAVGREEWTLPIPIAYGTEGWQFDVEAGHQEILFREIGRNELSAIQACLAYFDAQMEYALTDHLGDRVLEYARRLISTPGYKDGLYWAALTEETLSPLGPFFGNDEPSGDGYHGYHFRILEGQGESAPGGAYSYVINNRMIAGFALVAWPTIYDESGVMTFLISHDGQLYQRDLGPETNDVVHSITSFDPDKDWTFVETP